MRYATLGVRAKIRPAIERRSETFEPTTSAPLCMQLASYLT
jgi:hypothetical protein